MWCLFHPLVIWLSYLSKFWLVLPLHLKIQYQRIHAKALSGWRGAVVEDMAEMGVAAATGNLSAAHAVGVVGYVFNAIWFH